MNWEGISCKMSKVRKSTPGVTHTRDPWYKKPYPSNNLLPRVKVWEETSGKTRPHKHHKPGSRKK